MGFSMVPENWVSTASLLKRRSLWWAAEGVQRRRAVPAEPFPRARHIARRQGLLATALAAADLGGAPAAADSTLTVRVSAPPGVLVSVSAHQWYDEGTGDEGTNPEIVEATFSTTDYYDTHRVGNGRVWVQAKSDADLNALAVPPTDPFEVTVDVSMTNDEDLTIEGKIVFKTEYERNTTLPLPLDGEQT